MALNPLQRFHAKVAIDQATKCWNWTASKGNGGYGFFAWSGKLGLAHRFAYEFFRGPIPAGRHIDHLCRNQGCVNPAHLEIVTPKENTARGNASEIARQTQLSKTHCPQGHPYSGDNLYLKPNGRRECRACVIASGARYRERVGKGNKRPKFTMNGETRTLAAWAKMHNLTVRMVRDRIAAGWSLEDALTMRPRQRSRRGKRSA